MLVNHIAKIFLPLFLILNLVAAVQRGPINVEYDGGSILQERQLFKNSTKLIWGLFRSKSIIGLVGQIPCEIIEILEKDENEAESFFTQVQSGEVPNLIKNLPSEITDRIIDVVGIAITIPSDIIEGAEAIFKDTIELFNAIEDGSIFEKVEKLPAMVVSQITSGWGDLTRGFACAFVECPTTELAGGCLTTTTDNRESSTTAKVDVTPTVTSNSNWSPNPSPSPSPTFTGAYVPLSTAEVVATVTSTRSQTSTTLPSAQGPQDFTGLAAPMQLSFEAAKTSVIAALVGIIGVVLLL